MPFMTVGAHDKSVARIVIASMGQKIEVRSFGCAFTTMSTNGETAERGSRPSLSNDPDPFRLQSLYSMLRTIALEARHSQP